MDSIFTRKVFEDCPCEYRRQILQVLLRVAFEKPALTITQASLQTELQDQYGPQAPFGVSAEDQNHQFYNVAFLFRRFDLDHIRIEEFFRFLRAGHHETKVVVVYN
ncbi:hypothetical protein IM774_00050 [Erysipelotrichaceae bacterium RD49]|nr:hypothetical protein [Erysipelotrichaceae bacterium RD49]